ncbi:Vitamin B12 import ATP-binding protein BtuD [anaerobic digester metagenome]
MRAARGSGVFDTIETLSFHSVWKSYNGRRVLGPCDLEVTSGETLVLVGPSGSGKTTLLRMVNRLVEPDQGSVTINGTDVRTWDPVLLRRSIGYAIQQIGLFPHMSVAENIGLVLSLDGASRPEVEERVEELLHLVRLPFDEYGDRFPRELSGGQQQRVGLARALALDPPLLLMDEPFGALDPLLRAGLQEEFLALKQSLQTTILLVTHDLDEAFRLGDRIAVLHEGHLLAAARPGEIVLDPGVRAILPLARRSRYLEHMQVGEIAEKIDGWPVLDAALSSSEGLCRLADLRSPRALVVDNGVTIGAVGAADLVRADPERSLGGVAREVPRVSHHQSLFAAIDVIERSERDFALVFNGEDLTGAFFPSTALNGLDEVGP